MRLLASRFNEKGNSFMESGEFERAIKSFEQAIYWDRKWSIPWYNLGLLYKTKRMWSESAHANQNAVMLDRSNMPAWWNLGIAATAIQDWELARQAWTSYGVANVPSGTGPIEMKLGGVPIRLDPEGLAEVVWCKRVDPARTIIQSIPFPGSGHRFGDELLNDGAAVGHRMHGDREVPVFNELELIRPSAYGTYSAKFSNVATEQGQTLIQAAHAKGIEAEDWSESVQVLCKACSEGRPHAHHEYHPPAREITERRFGFAAFEESAVSALIERWLATSTDAKILGFACEIPPVR